MKEAIRYRVMRYQVLQGVFTFAELKQWMSEHIPDYRSDILNARNFYQLQNIAINSDYCSVKRVPNTH